MKAVFPRLFPVLIGLLAGLLPGLVSTGYADQTPQVAYNGGMRFDSQWGGTPNTLSAYGFAPLLQGEAGDVFYADGFLNLDIASMYANTNVGGSTRLGYRYLSPDKNWIIGANSGVDISPYQNTNFYQVGMGLEALSREVEFRVNGYLPFGTTNYYASSGYYNAYLANSRLYVNGYNTYGVALSSVEAEAGTSVFNWEGGNIKTYGAYYHLSGDYTTSTSGFRGRVESDLGDYVAIGSTVSYDDIYKTWGTGYIRIGLEPQNKPKGEELNFANSNFLAQRGLPVERTRNVRINMSQNNVGTQVAVGANGTQLNVVCNSNAAGSGCANSATILDKATFSSMVGTANTVVLLGNGTQVSLQGDPAVASGVTVSNGTNAPTVNTQFGAVNLARIFNAGTGANPIIGGANASTEGGYLTLASNTAITGLTFQNVSVTSQNTQNVTVSNNSFTGSYTDSTGQTTLGVQQYASLNALPTIQLNNVTGATISNNTITAPNVMMYASDWGSARYGSSSTSPEQICARDAAGLSSNGYCLSANAVNLTNSSGVTVTGNQISYAMDEAIKINNPTGTTTVSYNTITNTEIGPDTNQQAAIFTRMNSGTATVNVIGNDISQNDPGQFSVNSTTGLLTRTATTPDGSGGYNYQNIIDPIEVGLCRGTTSFPNADDAYSDSGFTSAALTTPNPNGIGNCATTTTLNYLASGNVIHDIGTTSNHDGIDFNIGTNGVFNATLSNNNISGLYFNNAAITGDSRGNAVVNETISGNIIAAASSTSGAPPKGIDLEFGPQDGTSPNETSGTSIITGNTITGTTRGAIGIGVGGASTSTNKFNLGFTITGNTISAAAGDGISIAADNARNNAQAAWINGGNITATVSGNTIALPNATSSNNAIAYASDQGAYTATLSLLNNKITEGASGSNAISIDLNTNPTVGSTNAANVTATIQGNSLTSSSTNAQIINLSNSQYTLTPPGYLGVYNVGSLTTLNTGFSSVSQTGVTPLP